MKTFIWSREYEVLAANADNVKEARKMLRPKLRNMLYPELIDEIKEFREYRIKYPTLSEFLKHEPDRRFYRSPEFFRNNIKYTRNEIRKGMSLLDKKPNQIIEENSASIFDHSNP